MEPMQLAIAALIIILGIVLVVVTYAKSGQQLDANQFVAMYGDFIMKSLIQAVDILELRLQQYDSAAEYYSDVIQKTIEILKENLASIGVKTSLFNTINTEVLADQIGKMLEDHKLEVFSTMEPKHISMNASLFDEEVVATLGAADDTQELDTEEEAPVEDPDDPSDAEYDATIGTEPPQVMPEYDSFEEDEQVQMAEAEAEEVPPTDK